MLTERTTTLFVSIFYFQKCQTRDCITSESLRIFLPFPHNFFPSLYSDFSDSMRLPFYPSKKFLSNISNTALRFGNQLASPYGRFLLCQKGSSQGRQSPYMTTATFFF